MKKTMLLALATLFLVSSYSCKKDEEQILGKEKEQIVQENENAKFEQSNEKENSNIIAAPTYGKESCVLYVGNGDWCDGALCKTRPSNNCSRVKACKCLDAPGSNDNFTILAGILGYEVEDLHAIWAEFNPDDFNQDAIDFLNSILFDEE